MELRNGLGRSSLPTWRLAGRWPASRARKGAAGRALRPISAAWMRPVASKGGRTFFGRPLEAEPELELRLELLPAGRFRDTAAQERGFNSIPSSSVGGPTVWSSISAPGSLGGLRGPSALLIEPINQACRWPISHSCGLSSRFLGWLLRPPSAAFWPLPSRIRAHGHNKSLDAAKQRSISIREARKCELQCFDSTRPPPPPPPQCHCYATNSN